MAATAATAALPLPKADMGKFDGVLIASDYDNTLVYTKGAMHAGFALPSLSPANHRAIESFIAQGGRFSVCTGRALPPFMAICRDLPLNAPVILSNGAGIYDLTQEQYIYTNFLPGSVRDCIAQTLAAHPYAAAEVYHDGLEVHALQSNSVTRHHLAMTGLHAVELSDASRLPLPICKVLFQVEPEHMPVFIADITAQPWAAQFEIVPSLSSLLELTAKNADKGTAVCRLAELLGIDMAHVYCIGDEANDLPMLRCSAIPFAPANAVDAVQQLPELHLLPDCRHDAIAAMIAELEKIY